MVEVTMKELLEAGVNNKVSVNTMVEPVGEARGNTIAISRKSYVHPALVEAAKERPRDPLKGMERPRARKWLTASEAGLLKFLSSKPRRSRKPSRA